MRLPLSRDGMCSSRTGPRSRLVPQCSSHDSFTGMDLRCTHTPLRASRVQHSLLGRRTCGCAPAPPSFSGLPACSVLSLSSRQFLVAFGHSALSNVGEAPNGLCMSRCGAHYPRHLMLNPRRTLRTEYDKLTPTNPSSTPLPILALGVSLNYGILQPYSATAVHRKSPEYWSQ